MEEFFNLSILGLGAGYSQGGTRLVYFAEESYALVVLGYSPSPEQVRHSLVTAAG